VRLYGELSKAFDCAMKKAQVLAPEARGHVRNHVMQVGESILQCAQRTLASTLTISLPMQVLFCRVEGLVTDIFEMQRYIPNLRSARQSAN